MSIITNLNLEKNFLNLKNNIEKMESLHDLLSFQIIISDSVKIMSLMSQLIKNKNNLFGKNILKESLINIISFLPIKYVSKCKNVCKLWLKNLKNNLAKKILLPTPKIFYHNGFFDVKFCPRTIFKIKNDIYINNHINVCKISTKKDKFITTNINLYRDIIYSNDRYICMSSYQVINIYSLEMELISNIPTKGYQGIAIDNNDNVLISTHDKFYI